MLARPLKQPIHPKPPNDLFSPPLLSPYDSITYLEAILDIQPGQRETEKKRRTFNREEATHF